MDERIQMLLRVLAVLSAVLLLTFVWLVFGVVIGALTWSSLESAVRGILCAGAVPASATGVLLLAYWLNRRDDPRHAKRPLDPP
jgi:hypothetical protein